MTLPSIVRQGYDMEPTTQDSPERAELPSIARQGYDMEPTTQPQQDQVPANAQWRV